jgi:hypothetical protein
MRRFNLAYVLVLGSVSLMAACEQFEVCENGLCLHIDLCNPQIENCGDVDSATEDLCPDGDIVSGPDRCPADGFCYELPDGRFCTGALQLSCPEGYSLETSDICSAGESSLCFIYAEGYACRLSSVYTLDECAAAGGEPVIDPGDGSVVTVGCGAGRATLGYIDADWDEGGLCCAWLPD